MITNYVVEAIGDNVTQMRRLYRDILNEGRPGLGDTFDGDIPSGYWVAEITGPDSQYRFARTFLRGKKDYSESNSIGSRGVKVWYIVESGKVYEAKSRVTWTRARRHFFRVNEATGDIEDLTEEEVLAWLKQRQNAG